MSQRENFQFFTSMPRAINNAFRIRWFWQSTRMEVSHVWNVCLLIYNTFRTLWTINDMTEVISQKGQKSKLRTRKVAYRMGAPYIHSLNFRPIQLYITIISIGHFLKLLLGSSLISSAYIVGSTKKAHIIFYLWYCTAEIQTWRRYDTYANLNLENTMTLLTVHSVHCIAFDSLPQYATVRMIHCKVKISGREPCKIRCTLAVQKLQLLCCEWYTYKNFFFWVLH